MQHIRLTQLDGLRGLFSLMLIFFHFPIDNQFAGIQITSNFIVRQSDLFVDFFFVLSGFVISFNYEKKLETSTDFTNYLWQRFLRLYPLLFYTVLLFLGFELFIHFFFPHLANSVRSVSSLLLQTLNSLLFLNSTPIIGGTGMNAPSWSISSEIISYIVFGLAVLLFKKNKKIVLAIILTGAAVFLISINSYMQGFVWGFVRGLVCFITGYFTFAAYKRFNTIKISPLYEYILSALLIVIFYLRYYHLKDRDLNTLFIIPPFFGISIFVYALSNGYITKIMSGKIFQYLGKISYSIYLNHSIVLIIITKTVFSIFKLPVNELSVAVTLTFCIIATIIYSHITYNVIERKGKTFLYNLLHKNKEEHLLKSQS